MAEKSTSYDALGACAQHPQMMVGMDGRGRAKDNIWVERFWKTIKYEYIYILPEENGTALYSGIKGFIDNKQALHSSGSLMN